MLFLKKNFPTQVPELKTYTAVTLAIFIISCIQDVVRMVTRAMRFGSPKLTCVPPTYIDEMRHSLQVFGVDTSTIAAKMIDLQTLWYRTISQFIDITMGQLHPKCSVRELGISRSRMMITIPCPAWGVTPQRAVLGDLGPKQQLWWGSAFTHILIVSCKRLGR